MPTLILARDAQITAQLLSKCLGVLGKATGHSYDITQSAGVSCDELVRQCCEGIDHSIEQVGSAMDQLLLITHLQIDVSGDTARMNILIDSLIKHRYVTFAARTMLNMEASRDPRVKHDTDRHRKMKHMDAQDTCLLMLPALLNRAEARHVATPTPAIEAIESNLLFVLENHSHSAIKLGSKTLSQLGSVSFTSFSQWLSLFRCV